MNLICLIVSVLVDLLSFGINLIGSCVYLWELDELNM